MTRDREPRRGMHSPEAFDHLRVSSDGLCWWCRERLATTGEHKFKVTDLGRLMADGSLVWVGDDRVREIRGKSNIKRDRFGIIKFPKSMCSTCNNVRSRPFDQAYSTFSGYLNSTWLRIMPGISFEEIYGDAWQSEALNLARYYAKHFGCRMVRSGLPVPSSLRAFLDGADDMQDAHMALVTTDSVHRNARKGLTLSGDFARADPDSMKFRGCVMAAYVGSIGVRYEWWEGERPDGWDSQFFQHPMPVINCFRDEKAVVDGITRQPGWFARFLQWLNRPPASGPS